MRSSSNTTIHWQSLPDPGNNPENLDEQIRLLRRLVARGEARRAKRTGEVQVRSVSFNGDRVLAKIVGREAVYDTHISFHPNPGHKCSCPDWAQSGQRVGPCKHVLRLAEVWWEQVYRKIEAVEFERTAWTDMAERVASNHERDIVQNRVAQLLRANEEEPDALVLQVDVLDLVDLEYRDLYGRPATRDEVSAILRSFAEDVEGIDEVWPRNLWVDALKEAFDVTDEIVLALPEEDLDELRGLWEVVEESDPDDEALDRFYERAEEALVEAREDGGLFVEGVPAKLAGSRVAKTKKLRVYDFDDTLVSSDGSVTIVKPDGERVTMNSATFAHLKQVPGDMADHGAFNNIVKPRVIKKNFDNFRKSVEAGERVVVLTARPKGSASAVKKFLKEHGIDGVDVVALASSDPYDKARWIDAEIESGGYDDIEFFDDSSANASAVEEHAAAHRKAGLKFESSNTPHPHEEDYDGPPSKSTFESDDPTIVLVPFKPKVVPAEKDAPDSNKGTSSWWDEQSPTFKKKYCGDHPNSQYCKMGSEVRVASNEARKKSIRGRADKSRNRKVETYIEEFLAKLDQAGPAGGAWIEDVESHFDDLVDDPEGLLKGFKDEDFDELYEVLFGVKRQGKKKSAHLVAQRHLAGANIIHWQPPTPPANLALTNLDRLLTVRSSEFLRSVRAKVAAGEDLSDEQKRMVRQEFYKAQMKALAEAFR